MRRPKPRACRPLVAGLVAIMAIGGCGAAPDPTTSAPPSDRTMSSATPTAASAIGTLVPFAPTAYPASGEAPCGEAAAPDGAHDPYRGDLRRISAPDATTVVFELCEADVAFPSRLALPPFAIQDVGWLTSHVQPDGAEGQAISREVNGTGPFRLESWHHGADITTVRHPAYWGSAAMPERAIVRWSENPANRLVDLGNQTVDGVDTLGAAEVAAANANADLTVKTRDGLNTAYIGFNDRYAPFDSEVVRRAIGLGIDRAAIVERLFPPGATVATHFAPCAIPFGCEGDAWPEDDAIAAKEMLATEGYVDGFTTTIRYSDTPRDYLPDPTAVATELQAQLLANLGITATLEVVDLDTLIASADAGTLDGIHLLGSRPTVADASAALDPRFGAGSSAEFGSHHDAITRALETGATSVDPEVRAEAYAEANDAIRRHVPMVPLAHVGESIAYRADVLPNHASPVGLERFASMKPGDRSQLVWMQASEPDGLYCADETEPDAWRACAQLLEGLYAFDAAGASISPALSTGCVPDDALLIWTCQLREDVTFHDGATLDAADVVTSFAVQWDVEHPLHGGRTGAFAPFPLYFGGFLNPPVGP